VRPGPGWASPFVPPGGSPLFLPSELEIASLVARPQSAERPSARQCVELVPDELKDLVVLEAAHALPPPVTRVCHLRCGSHDLIAVTLAHGRVVKKPVGLEVPKQSVRGQSLVRAFGHEKSAPLGVIFNSR
jgi:hypothetical protein